MTIGHEKATGNVCNTLSRHVHNRKVHKLNPIPRSQTISVPLSTGEYDLLMAIVERPQRVLNRDQLLDLDCGRAASTFDRSIDTQASRLRTKIERDPADLKMIKTVWGGGYSFTAAVSSNEPLSAKKPVRTGASS